MLGRTFREGDDVLGAPLTAVLSHGLWQELGSDAAIVGKPIHLGGLPRTVIGVMPRGFWFPGPGTRVWTSAPLDPQNGSGRYSLVARVPDGASIHNMQGPLRGIADRLDERFDFPEQFDPTKAPDITPAREFIVGDVRPSLVATFAAMGAILLIACANVAALMLGQVDARSTEMAIRAALGANRRRLIQQLVMESLVVGIIAGVAGAGIALVAFQLLLQSLPLGALAQTTTLDWTVFWAAVLTSLAAALLIAFVPGVALWRGNLQGTMATARTAGIAGRGGRLEGGLVVAQMALAVLLTAGAGLLIRSVVNLNAIHPGIHTDGVVVLDATMPSRLPGDARRRTILEMLPVLQSLPGARSVAAAQKLPLRGSGDNWGITIQGKPDLPQTTTAFRMVTRDYFSTLGIPIKAGRTFGPSDRDTSDRVVIVNEALAAKYFPGEDPIGRVLLTGFDDRGERIVGVVGNAAEAELTDGPVPTRYMLYDQIPSVWHQVSFVVRAERAEDVPALLDAARSAIRRDGVQLALQETTTMTSIFTAAVGPAGQIATLLSLLAGLALVLGAVGVYGVISHYVTRRSRDYGICIAIGMPPARVVTQVVGRGLTLVATGSVLGIAAAIALTRVISTLLYDVRATDPIALAAAVLILLVVGLLAAFVPARRASLTDPAAALRH
jgi:predicted permease